MELQHIFDEAGNQTAVIVPIDQWNEMANKLQGEKELTIIHPNKTDKKKPSDFAGTISDDDAAKLRKYVAKSKKEWERNS